MISEHGYPKEWFFSVVIWGINNLIQSNDDNTSGLHHGMVRKEWKPRAQQVVEEKEKEKEKEDKEMVEGLVESFEKSSLLEFVPRSVVKRRKNKPKMSIETSSVT